MAIREKPLRINFIGLGRGPAARKGGNKMARGQKYNDDIKEKVRALLSVNNNATLVAEELDLPESTVRTWRKEFEKDDSFDELRRKKKEQFISDAWELIDVSKSILEKRLRRANEAEEELDLMMEELAKADSITDSQRRALYKKLESIKIEDIGKLAVVLGTIYDKQALANKEATSIIDGSIAVKKFEDF